MTTCVTEGARRERHNKRETTCSACSSLSDGGEDGKGKGTRKVVFALSQSSGPDYLGAWNRLLTAKPERMVFHGLVIFWRQN